MADEPETNDVDRTKKKIGRAWKLMDTLWCMGGHIGDENWEKVKAKGCWLRGNGDVIFDSNTPVEEIKPFLDMVGGYGSLKGFEWREGSEYRATFGAEKLWGTLSFVLPLFYNDFSPFTAVFNCYTATVTNLPVEDKAREHYLSTSRNTEAGINYIAYDNHGRRAECHMSFDKFLVKFFA